MLATFSKTGDLLLRVEKNDAGYMRASTAFARSILKAAKTETDLMEEGFTGEVTDTLGRKIHYVNGVRVKKREVKKREEETPIKQFLAQLDGEDVQIVARDAKNGLAKVRTKDGEKIVQTKALAFGKSPSDKPRRQPLAKATAAKVARANPGQGGAITLSTDELQDVLSNGIKGFVSAGRNPPVHGKYGQEEDGLYDPDPTADSTGSGVADAARVGVPGSAVPPPPPIGRLPRLTKNERLVEARFADKFQENPEALVKAYMAGKQRQVGVDDYGQPKYESGDAPNVFSTDDCKMLSDVYNPPKEAGLSPEDVLSNRSRYNTVLHQTANAIAKRAFLQYLDQLPEDKKTVLVTSGGVAAGKGFALGRVDAVNNVAKMAGAVWDAAGEQNGTENEWILAECQNRGIQPTFLYVHSDPAQTWENPKRGVVERAGKNGRMVDARLFADSYAIGAKNFHAFHQANKDKAQFFILDNTEDGKDQAGNPSVVSELPKDALILDGETLYHRCVAFLQQAASVHPAVKRGGTNGLRIWPAKGTASTKEAEEADYSGRGRDLLEAGFTGTFPDSLGRMMKFVDGKHVKGTVKNAGGSEVHATKSVTLNGKAVTLVAQDPKSKMVKVKLPTGETVVAQVADLDFGTPKSEPLAMTPEARKFIATDPGYLAAIKAYAAAAPREKESRRAKMREASDKALAQWHKENPVAPEEVAKQRAELAAAGDAHRHQPYRAVHVEHAGELGPGDHPEIHSPPAKSDSLRELIVAAGDKQIADNTASAKAKAVADARPYAPLVAPGEEYKRTWQALHEHGFKPNGYRVQDRDGTILKPKQGWIRKNLTTGKWEGFSSAQAVRELNSRPTGNVTESLLFESGFTGEIKDKLGRRRRFVNGDPVKIEKEPSQDKTPGIGNVEVAADPATYDGNPVKLLSHDPARGLVEVKLLASGATIVVDARNLRYQRTELASEREPTRRKSPTEEYDALAQARKARPAQPEEDEGAAEPFEWDGTIERRNIRSQSDREEISTWDFYGVENQHFAQQRVYLVTRDYDPNPDDPETDPVNIYRWESHQDDFGETESGKWTTDEDEARADGKYYAQVNNQEKPEEEEDEPEPEEEDDSRDEDQDDEDFDDTPDEPDTTPAPPVPPKKIKAPKSKADVEDLAGAEGELERIFPDLSSEDAMKELASIVGAPDDAEVKIINSGKYVALYSDDMPLKATGVRVKIKHEKLGRCNMFVGVDSQGKRFVRLEIIEVLPEHQKGGFAAEIVAKMVDNATADKMDYISLHAAGSKDQRMNGYYTWPRMGWDESVSRLQRSNKRLYERIKRDYPEVKRIREIMTTEDGQKWWSENGSDLHDACFDLHDGSWSQYMLAQYQEEKRQKKAKG